MKTSSFQIILLAIFAALAVAGFLIFSFAVSRSATGSIGPLTVWGTLDGTTFSTYLRELAQVDPNLNQVTYLQKDIATYDTDLTQAIASGKAPDLMLIRQDYAVRNEDFVQLIPYTQQSWALSQSQFADTFADVADPFLAPDGVVAVPFLVDPLVLYWNKDILATAGFAQPPQYWDQLPGMVAAITQRGDAGQVQRSTIALGEYANVDHAKDILALMILQAGGSITERDVDGKLVAALAGGTAGAASEKALDFYTSFANPSRSESYTWNRSLPSSLQAFAAGQSALYIGFASENALIRKTNPNLNYTVAKVPQIRAASRATSLARVYGLAIPRNTKNLAGSVGLAYSLAASTSAMMASQSFGLAPARRDLLSAGGDGDAATYYAETIRGLSWIDPDPLATEGVFKSMIENITSGATPVLTVAIQRAQEQLNHILGI